MGLVQLFQELPCPDILARHLLELVLADFRESGRHYGVYLLFRRATAETKQEVEAFDEQIRRYQLQAQIPQHRGLSFLFSEAGYALYGDGLLPLWSIVLIEICTLEQYWEGTLLGEPAGQPYLLPGFHSDEAVWSPAWLEDHRRTWDRNLRDV